MKELQKKLYDLKHQRAQCLKTAQDALGHSDMTAYKTAMEQAAAFVPQIDATQDLINDMAQYMDEPQMPTPVTSDPSNVQDVKEMRASREYVRAFAFAAQNGLNLKNARSHEQAKILLDALQETGGSPEGADGGFLVPVDMETQINAVRRQQIALADLFHTETTFTRTGFRVYDTQPTKGFTKVSEMGQIPKDDKPQFKRVDFAVEDYSLIVPMSNDLLADNAAGLMRYLASWMGRKSVLTENINLLALLGALTSEDLAQGKEYAGIKTALNKGLDPSISVNAKILTNQSGFNALDQLVDTQGRDLLQPDPRQPETSLLRGRQIVVVSDALLPNASEKAPVYIGDFTQFGTLIRRAAMELATTNVGGNSWATNSTEARAIMRIDEIKTDENAVVKREIAVGA